MNRKNKKLNRRLAFRVYEYANLFYQKIDPAGVGGSGQAFAGMLQGYANAQGHVAVSSGAEAAGHNRSLPESQSQENDTLNVNISSSGIAFTCQESLQVGDYLLLRIILLSRMTVIMTCCQVVYSKPSNPYETDLYPYWVGARFVNLTPADKALLERHISRRQKQRWFINGLWVALAVVVLSMPEEIFELLLEIVADLWDVFWEDVDIARDYVNYGLSYFLEHTFGTSRYFTQIIGFYLQLALEFVVTVLSLRMLWLGGKHLWQRFVAFLLRKKASFLYYWNEKTWLGKLQIMGVGIAAISAYVLLLL